MISRATPAHVSLYRATRSFVGTELQLSQQIENSSGSTGIAHATRERPVRALLTVASRLLHRRARVINLETDRGDANLVDHAAQAYLKHKKREKINVKRDVGIAEKGDSFFGKVGTRARASKLESSFFAWRSFVRPRPPRKVKVIKEPPRCCDRCLCTRVCTHA